MYYLYNFPSDLTTYNPNVGGTSMTLNDLNQ